MKEDFLASSRKIKRKRLVFKLIFLVVFSLFLAGAYVGFLFVPKFKIKNIEIAGNSTLMTEDLILEIKNILAQKTLWFLPSDNIIFFPKEKIVDSLQTKFLRIKETTISRNLPNLISIEVRERGPEMLLCQEEKKCFYVDDTGFVFEQAPYFSDNVYIKIVDQRGGSSFLSKQLIPVEHFQKINNFQHYLFRESLRVSKIFLLPDEIYKIQLIEGWHILMKGTGDEKNDFSNLQTALSKIGDKRSQLEKMDLVLENKVYYTFK